MRITVASAQLFLGKQCHYRTSVKNRVNVVCTLVGDKYGTFLFVQKKKRALCVARTCLESGNSIDSMFVVEHLTWTFV